MSYINIPVQINQIFAEHFNDLIGKIATRDIENDEQLDYTDFE
jgi:N-acetylneuraminate synthase